MWLAHLADYWTLTKPEVNFLVLVSALVGFYLAAPGTMNGWLLFHTLMGTLLVASGTGTLNQYLERRTDAFMRRTANRPLPAGRLRHGKPCGSDFCFPSPAGRNFGLPPIRLPACWRWRPLPPT